MFEDILPKRRIGLISALAADENGPYIFYKIAPKDVMCIYLSVGLEKFTPEDVERVYKPMDRIIDKLLERDSDVLVQGGVPLALLMGVKAHHQLMEHIAQRSGLPVSSSVTAATAAAKHMGMKKIAVVNKWSDPMNRVLGEFFARDGVKVLGVSSESMTPDKFLKMDTASSMDLAYELGRQALQTYSGCDGLYIGGGAWMVLPVAEVLEKEFGVPCISSQDSLLWDTLHKVDYWKPIQGHNRLLASA
jgi:maleate cis-trans isomerase